MKFNILFLIPLLALATGAQAEEAKKDTLFVPQYLGCKEVRQATKGKKESEKTCQQKVALQYCSIFDKLPKDVKSSLSLELYCNFIAGEQNGDATHDAKILSTATAVGCFEGSEAREKLAHKYARRADVSDALDNFTRMLMVNETACEQAAKEEAEKPKEEKKAEDKKADAKEPETKDVKEAEIKDEPALGQTQLPTRQLEEKKPQTPKAETPKEEKAKEPKKTEEPAKEEAPKKAEAKPAKKEAKKELSKEEKQALEDAGIEEMPEEQQ